MKKGLFRLWVVLASASFLFGGWGAHKEWASHHDRTTYEIQSAHQEYGVAVISGGEENTRSETRVGRTTLQRTDWTGIFCVGFLEGNPHGIYIARDGWRINTNVTIEEFFSNNPEWVERRRSFYDCMDEERARHKRRTIEDSLEVFAITGVGPLLCSTIFIALFYWIAAGFRKTEM